MQQKQCDVLIVGAGVVGASCALLLAERFSELRVVVLERGPQQLENKVPNLRVFALGSAATGVLRQLGVFDELGEAACYAYDKMFVWDENSPGELRFEASELGADQLGHMVDASALTIALQQRLEQHPRVDVEFDTAGQTLDWHTDQVVLSTDQIEYHARLAIAADGGRSWLRQQAKIFSEGHDYAQAGIVARIKTAESHQDTAWQRFLSTGPLAILPLADNQSSIVWSADTELAEQLLALDNTEFAQRLQSALQDKLGTVELLTEPVAFPLKSQRAETYFKERLVLVGDAAHSIHPLAGQGANLGFKDVLALLEVIERNGTGTLGALTSLQQYQRQRRVDNQQTDAMMSGLHMAFKIDEPMWQMARGVGMNLISSALPLKQLLARQAMGT